MEKQAIVTGGAVRVGKTISLNLAENGYDVILLYNKSVIDAEKTKAEIENLGKKCYLYQCDISKTKNLETSFTEIFKNHKNIELLVNNSAVFEKHTLQQTNEAIFDKHFDINLKAPFFISNFYASYCEKNLIKNTHIINILDSYIKSNSVSYFAYLLSKKSLANFTEMAAVALAPNIRVNAVSIGLLLASEFWDEAMINKRTLETPLQKRIKIADITNAISYLNNNPHITGNNIFVDGGLALKF